MAARVGPEQRQPLSKETFQTDGGVTQTPAWSAIVSACLPVFPVAPFVSKERERRGCSSRGGCHTQTQAHPPATRHDAQPHALPRGGCTPLGPAGVQPRPRDPGLGGGLGLQDFPRQTLPGPDSSANPLLAAPAPPPPERPPCPAHRLRTPVSPGLRPAGQQAAGGPGPNPNPAICQPRGPSLSFPIRRCKSDSLMEVLGPVGGSSAPDILSLNILNSASRRPSIRESF